METSVLSDRNYLAISRDRIQELGIKAAVLYAELCQEYMFCRSQGLVEKDGFFPSTTKYIENQIGFSPKIQREALKILEEHGYVKTSVHGIPAKKYYQLFY